MESDLSLPGTVSCSVGMLKVMHWDKESYQTGSKTVDPLGVCKTAPPTSPPHHHRCHIML
ncbi:hypothetical protein AAG906_003943 [Vitis piasezkii]